MDSGIFKEHLGAIGKVILDSQHIVVSLQTREIDSRTFLVNILLNLVYLTVLHTYRPTDLEGAVDKCAYNTSLFLGECFRNLRSD